VEEVARREFKGSPPRHISLYVYRDNPGAQDLYFKAGFMCAPALVLAASEPALFPRSPVFHKP